MSNVVDKSLLRVSGVIQVFHYLSTLPPEYPSLQDVIAKIVPDEVISFLHLANGIVSDFLNDRARAVFDSCDRDNDGLLDSKELSEAMKLLRVDPHAEALQSFFNSIGFDPDTLEVGRDLFYHIFPAIAMSSVIIESSSVLNPESESGDSASAASPTPPPTTTSTDMSLPAATTPDVSAPESDESGSVSDIEQEVQEQKNFRKEEITASAESVDIDYSVSHDSSLVLQDDLLDPPTNPNELEEYCRKMKTYVEALKLQLSSSEGNEKRLQEMLKRREGNFNQLEDHLGKVEEQVRRKDELILSLKTKRSRRTSHHTTGNQSGAAQKTEQSNPTEELHKELEELRLSYANLVKEHTDLQEKLISIRKNDSTSPPSASSELPKVLHNSGGPTEGASNCTTESSEKSTWTPRTGLRSFNNGSDIESDDSSISTSSSKESKAIPISLEQEIQEEIKDEQTHKKCCMELDSLTRRYNDLEEVHKKLQETSEELVRDAKTKSQNLQNQLEQQQAVHVDRMSQLQLELETEQTRNKELQARSSKAIAEAKAKELQLETQSRQALGRVSTLEQEVTRLRSTYQQALKKLAANQETCTRLEAEAANRSKEMEEMERTMTNISKKLHEASRTRPERDLSQSPTLIPQLPSRFISPQSSPPNAPSPMMNPPSPRSNPTSPIMIPQTPPYKMKTVVQKVIMQQDSLKQVKQLALENSLKQATEAKNAIELEYNALRQLHEQTEESLASALNLQQQLQTRCDEQCLELSQNTKKFEEERATLLHDISDTKFKLESALIELGQTKNRCVELAQQSTDLQHMLQHTNEAHTQQYAEYQAVIQSQSRKREELEVALTEATTKIKYLEQELNSACQNVGLLSEKLSQSTNTCKQLEQNLSVSREETRKIEALLAETRGNAQALETKKEEMRANLTSALDQVLQLNKMLEEEHNLHQKTTIQLHQAREELTNLQIRVEESTTSRKDSAIPDKEDSHSDTSPRDLANYTSQLESQLEAMQRELDAANRKLESAVDEKSCSNQVAQVESEHVVVQMEPASPTADPEKPHTEKTPLLHHSADPPLHTATSTVTAINILESELQPIKPKTCWKVPATALVTVALCCSCCCAVVCLWWVSRSKDK